MALGSSCHFKALPANALDPAFKNNPNRLGHTPKAPVWAMGRENPALDERPSKPLGKFHFDISTL